MRVFTKNLANYLGIGVGAGKLATLLSGAGKVSVSAKIKITSVDNAANGNNILVANINGTTVGVVLNIDGTGLVPKLRVSARSVAGDTRQVLSGATTLPLATEIWVGAVIDYPADTLKVYVNGVLDGSASVTFANAAFTLGTPTGTDTVGGYLTPPGATTDQFAGSIGEVAVWRSALTAADFAKLAAANGALATAPGTEVYYLPLVSGLNPEAVVVGSDQGIVTGSLGSDVPAATVIPTPIVEMEFGGVGLGWTMVNTDLVGEEGMTITTGIQGGGPSDRVASAGTVSFALKNDTSNSAGLLGYYSLYHANKRAGWGLGIGCRIRFYDPNTGRATTRMAAGRIDAIAVEPGLYAGRRVHVLAVDWMDEAARWTITPEVGEQADKSWDQIIAAIVAEMPRAPVLTSLDAGSENYPFALDQSSNTRQAALAEFQNLALSEIGQIFVTAAGTLRAEGRHRRLLHTTVDWAITDALTPEDGMELPSSRDDIINTIRVAEHPKTLDAVQTTVYRQANAIDIAPGETKMLLGSYRDDVTGDTIGATEVLAPVAGVDYVANSVPAGTGTDLTSSISVTVAIGSAGARFEITNAAAVTAYLTVLRLRGRGIHDRGVTQFEATDAASVAALGEHVATYDMPYQYLTDVGQAAADYFLAKYSSTLARVQSIRLVAKSSAILAHLLLHDISDRFSIVETVTGASAQFFVNGIQLQVLPSRHLEATYILAPAADPFDGVTFFTIGTSALDGPDILAPF